MQTPLSLDRPQTTQHDDAPLWLMPCPNERKPPVELGDHACCLSRAVLGEEANDERDNESAVPAGRLPTSTQSPPDDDEDGGDDDGKTALALINETKMEHVAISAPPQPVRLAAANIEQANCTRRLAWQRG
ncbi:hypothetical protein TARUN_4033 [Trichoderma arundinaceum]|uniref:Uncharacterized protein n=1 Tax=Trichoderma arundinaceum TaxID=490622 RepID=A0A395NQF0_TRIAR|nr:hypothetical protein TARUN_4033 [Trichoderma arundinaceum]